MYIKKYFLLRATTQMIFFFFLRSARISLFGFNKLHDYVFDYTFAVIRFVFLDKINVYAYTHALNKKKNKNALKRVNLSQVLFLIRKKYQICILIWQQIMTDTHTFIQRLRCVDSIVTARFSRACTWYQPK